MRAAARSILPGSLVNPSRVVQQVSAIVIMAMGMATPTMVSAAGSRRVKESRAPRTSGTGSRTSRPMRASRDSRPRGGEAATAATGDTRPARHAGTTVATATVPMVPAAASAIQEAGSGVRATGMPSGGPMNAGLRVAAHAPVRPTAVAATPSAVCSASSARTTWPGVNPSAPSIAMSRRCTSTRAAVTLAIA